MGFVIRQLTSNDSIQYYLEQAKEKYQNNFQEALVSTQLAEKIAVENNYDDVPEINLPMRVYFM